MFLRCDVGVDFSWVYFNFLMNIQILTDFSGCFSLTVFEAGFVCPRQSVHVKMMTKFEKLFENKAGPSMVMKLFCFEESMR